MSIWCLFLDPHLTTHQSNKATSLIKKSSRTTPAYLALKGLKSQEVNNRVEFCRWHVLQKQEDNMFRAWPVPWTLSAFELASHAPPWTPAKGYHRNGLLRPLNLVCRSIIYCLLALQSLNQEYLLTMHLSLVQVSDIQFFWPFTKDSTSTLDFPHEDLHTLSSPSLFGFQE